jgi:hypothetical protein
MLRHFSHALASLGLALALSAQAAPAPAPAPSPTAPAAPLQANIGGELRLPLSGAAASLCPQSSTLRLQLSGYATGLTPVGCDSDAAHPTVTFQLSPETAGNDQAVSRGWQTILGKPWSSHRNDFIRQFNATVHDANGQAVQPGLPLNLQLVTAKRLDFGLLLIAAMWAILIHFGRHSSMLRDSNSTASDLQRPYSLSRVQMAWWFGLVFTAYVLIWMMTWDWVPLTTTTLSLLGISSATGLVAAGIDQPGGKQARTVDGTAGFLRDILTDINGITLARLQMVIWNASLGSLFLVQVLADLRIPELDPSTLALLGLSAGAYVGFKVPEQQNPTPATDSSTPQSSSPADTVATTPTAATAVSEGNLSSAPPLPADDPKAGYGV